MEDKDSLATGSSKDIVPSSTNVTDGDVNTSQKIDFSIANWILLPSLVKGNHYCSWWKIKAGVYYRHDKISWCQFTGVWGLVGQNQLAMSWILKSMEHQLVQILSYS